MTDERFFIGQPVSSLQHMLGQLSYGYEVLPFVAVDGVFGEETLEAVMVFQREFAPPVTGKVDVRTWDAIVALFIDWEMERAGRIGLRGFPAVPFVLRRGDRDETAALAQIMLRSLSGVLEGIVEDEPDGVYTAQTAENICWLQQLAGLEADGVLDRITWDALMRLYDLFIVRRRELESEKPQTALKKR